jgi:hypothetical protein
MGHMAAPLNIPPEALHERLWDAIAEVRDASPRVPNDAPTDDIVDVAMKAMAAELRRLADEFARHPDRSIAMRHRARADELDGGVR